MTRAELEAEHLKQFDAATAAVNKKNGTTAFAVASALIAQIEAADAELTEKECCDQLLVGKQVDSEREFTEEEQEI